MKLIGEKKKETCDYCGGKGRIPCENNDCPNKERKCLECGDIRTVKSEHITKDESRVMLFYHPCDKCGWDGYGECPDPLCENGWTLCPKCGGAGFTESLA